MILRKLVLSLAAFTSVAAPPAYAFAQAAAQAQGASLASAAMAGSTTVRVDLTGGSASQSLAIPKGKSAIVELPVDARDVLVTNPAVADAVLRSPRRIYVLGMAAGQTDAVFFDAAGRRILSLNIRVDQDTSALAQTINRIVPGAQVKVDAMNDSVILSGMVMTATDADRAVQIARASVSKPEQVLNMLSIAGKDQVMVKVRIVEMQRSVIKQLGVNTEAVLNQLGEAQFLFSRANTFGVNGGLLGGLTGGYKLDTTSQPIVNAYADTAGWPSTAPFANFLNGLSQLPFGDTGISLSSIGSFVSRFLTGTGGALTTAQSDWIKTYLNGFAGRVTVTDVNGVNYSMADLNITANDLPTLVNDYLNNNSANSNLNSLGKMWVRNFVDQLPEYNNAYNYTYDPSSTFRDRTNPAAGVATGRAGSAGLNQATGMLQAFERVGLVRTLAEPNLTAVSGESARFLAGGEFPVPVGQDDNGRVTIEFKPFGVGLGFTPVVMSGGRISLKISTEVSELSQQGAFTVSNGNGSAGLTIPALDVRRAETTVELPSGGAMMIAGLLREHTRQNIDALPGMTTLPVLGALFRSRDYQSGETELVVIVTPYIVQPTSPDRLQTPVDGLKIASDPETVLLGRLNRVYKTKPAPAGAPPTYQGPYGYVIE